MSGELIRRVATGSPVGELFPIQAIGHLRMPIVAYRFDHDAKLKLAAIDAHRKAEAAADLDGGLDDRVAGDARRERLEIGDFPGRAGRGIPYPPPRSLDAKRVWAGNGLAGMCIAWTTLMVDTGFRKRNPLGVAAG